MLVSCGTGMTPTLVPTLAWPALPTELPASPTIPPVVTSVEQASKLVQQFERKLHDEMYGKEGPHPPLASADKPHSVVEKGEYYVFEFRKPFGPAGGGYIKMFHVHKLTGKVTKGAWTLGR